jgi:hypothetical protein
MYILLLFLFISSCTSKKKIVEYRDRIQKDTITLFKDRVISKPVKEIVTIEEPCDSTGILRDFSRTIKTEKAKVVISNNAGNLEVKVDIDSIVDSRVSEFKKSYKQDIQIKEKEVVKFRIPFWVWLVISLSVGLNVFLIKDKIPFL